MPVNNKHTRWFGSSLLLFYRCIFYSVKQMHPCACVCMCVSVNMCVWYLNTVYVIFHIHSITVFYTSFATRTFILITFLSDTVNPSTLINVGALDICLCVSVCRYMAVYGLTRVYEHVCLCLSVDVRVRVSAP